MPQTITLELFKEDMKFSAGHFTVFSATERENLHGHNFRVHAVVEAEVLSNGMCFDYGVYKKRLRKLCDQWDEILILPGESPYLKIESDETYVYALFNGERLPFLKRDVLVLPIANATVEEFSRLLLAELTQDPEELAALGIHSLSVKVFSGPGQSGASHWRRPA